MWGAFNSIADPNNLTAVSTAVIAIFTVVLATVGYVQARLIRKTVDLARSEFISTHRPKIILRDVHLVGEEVIYLLVNVGATSATVIESWIVAEFVEQNTRLRPLRSQGHYDLGRLVFEGGETKDLAYRLPAKVSFAIKFPDTRRIGIEGQPPVFGKEYFVGVLVCEDSMGVRRRSVFRRRWDAKSLSFVRLSPDEERDHEYAD